MFENKRDNQTHFGFEEPLFEAPSWPQRPSNPDEVTLVTSQKKKMLIIGIVVTLVILFLLVMLALMTSRSSQPQLTDEPTASPMNESLSPIEAKINDLRQELKAADPTQQELPFPPVQMNIFLDNPEAR